MVSWYIKQTYSPGGGGSPSYTYARRCTLKLLGDSLNLWLLDNELLYTYLEHHKSSSP